MPKEDNAARLAIDVHAHVLSTQVERLTAGHPGLVKERDRLRASNGAASQTHNATLMREVWHQALTDVEIRFAAMDAARIDRQVLSLAPTQYPDWADEALAGEIVAAANEEIAELITTYPDRLHGLGSVSLRYPDRAVDQLEHAVTTLGLRGIELSSSVSGRELSDPAHEPLWERAADLGAVIFIHPLGCSLGERLHPYYLGNVIGQPLETTIALSHLILAGVLERHPTLRLCAAHGGGYLPVYLGRHDHAWQVRPEAFTIPHAPGTYLRQVWVDSLVYTANGLRTLVDTVGVDRVMLGSDYPYDMAVDNPVDQLEQLNDSLTPAQLERIRSGNAQELFQL